ncbi:hypothetical protein PENSPDRAFT_682388 [Peniophora sp. CONT]|nr:hypothetical protein PENSPDRAFT_682388 [Peniophora sp. CONT]
MPAVRTHEPPVSGITTPMTETAFIIDDDGFWVPSPSYNAPETDQGNDTTPPPPAPMPFSSLWPFILQETLCKGTPPFTLADRDAAYTRWYASQPGMRKEILEDELVVGYELCAERFSNGKAHKRVRYEAFWDEKGRRSTRPSPLRNTVHQDKPTRRILRRAPASSEHHHQPVTSRRSNMNNVPHLDRTVRKTPSISLFEELVAVQRPRYHAAENMENVLSLASSKRHVRSFGLGYHSAPLVPVNGVR